MSRGSKREAGKVGPLLAAIRRSKKVVILPHDNPDPDSLASAAALRFLIQQKRGKAPVIGLSGIIGRSENRALVSVLKIPLVPINELFSDFQGSVILVDTQPGRGNNSLPSHIIPAAIIDHHPDWGGNGEIPFVDLRETYGATSTILTEYLQDAEVRIESRIATALFYGISSETQHLGRETRPPDIVASQFLYPYVDKRLLGEIVNPRLSPAYFRVVGDALKSATVYGDTVVITLRSVPYPDAVAELADYFMRLQSAKWAICLAPHKGFLYVSLRTNDPKATAGLLLASILPSGMAGGHGMIAGGKIKLSHGKRKLLARKIVGDILQTLGRGDLRPQRLVNLTEPTQVMQ